MSVEVYLGNPPENIKAWIQAHLQPTGHPETRFTLEGGNVETYNITGTLDLQWMIDHEFFNDNNWLKTITSVDIGNTVTSIGSSAFEGCSNLTSVTIPDSVTNIDENVFSQCRSLINVIIPNNVTSIAYGIFSGCLNLTSVTMPEGVVDIGDSAFYYCGLTSITIPASVTIVGFNAF